MKYKATSLKLYNRNTISSYIPNVNAVYYLRGIADDTSLYPIYLIGRAGKLRDHLLRQFTQENRPEVVYLNYIEFDSWEEAKTFEEQEIARHKPKYNVSEVVSHQKINSFINIDFKV